MSRHHARRPDRKNPRFRFSGRDAPSARKAASCRIVPSEEDDLGSSSGCRHGGQGLLRRRRVGLCLPDGSAFWPRPSEIDGFGSGRAADVKKLPRGHFHPENGETVSCTRLTTRLHRVDGANRVLDPLWTPIFPNRWRAASGSRFEDRARNSRRHPSLAHDREAARARPGKGESFSDRPASGSRPDLVCTDESDGIPASRRNGAIDPAPNRSGSDVPATPGPSAHRRWEMGCIPHFHWAGRVVNVL